MNAYPDTSFLYAIYRKQVNSPAAAAFFQKMPEPLTVSSLLLYEFRQSVRFQATRTSGRWRRPQDCRSRSKAASRK